MTTFEKWKAGKFVGDEHLLKSTVIPACKAYALYLSYRNDGLKFEDAVDKVSESCCIGKRTVVRCIALVTK
jgi:hypothetical protein